MGIITHAAGKLGQKSAHKEATEDCALTRRQSWRREPGGTRPNWKSLDTGYFSDGLEFERPRLEAWLRRCSFSSISKKATWSWKKIEANGFRIICQRSTGDENPEEICFEDILGILCTHTSAEPKESGFDHPHENAAYFRRTNLHASEDASDFHSLVCQVEGEYHSQSGQTGQSGTWPVPFLDHPLQESDFAILTTRMGFYRGSPIIFRASCQEEKEQWVETLRRIIKFESASHLAPLGSFARFRRMVRTIYTGPSVQLFVAGLIVSNFFVNIIQAQTGGSLDVYLEKVDLFFTGIFSFELIVNLFATLFAEFFSDAWNYFDTVVVCVGLVTLAVPDLPGGSTLKLMRTFRVFRLFKRIPSLKHLVGSIFKAIPAMGNAYILMTILTSIYAILCVKFFGALGGDSTEFFGDFFSAVFSLWQIMTGDDWSKIVRDIFVPSGMPAAVAIFFVSYQLLITFTMLNVVVCVLV